MTHKFTQGSIWLARNGDLILIQESTTDNQAYPIKGMNLTTGFTHDWTLEGNYWWDVTKKSYRLDLMTLHAQADRLDLADAEFPIFFYNGILVAGCQRLLSKDIQKLEQWLSSLPSEGADE